MEPRKLAVITGASSGIGYELAQVCVENSFDVVLVAEQGLEPATDALAASGAVVQAVPADLATAAGNEALVAAVRALSRPVDLLALNAGVAAAGPFLETTLEDDQLLLQTNVHSVVHLAKRLLPDMVSRGQGRVLITSSIAATMPGPFYATYAASKAFVLSFAEAIRYELKSTGVTVTALMPGPTDTDFFDRAGMQDTPVYSAKKDDPAEVARDGFEAAMKGDDKVVAGSVTNKVQAAAAKVIPEPIKAALHAAQTKPENTE